MTDSQSDRATTAEPRLGKRERLVAAAARLLHQQGSERTTLAEIAKLADVPVGNVYYYFKTKDDVIGAVIDAHARQIRATLAAIETRHRSPKARLKTLVRELASQRELVAQYGCPLGSLCSELDKRGPEPAFTCSQLMRLPLDWAEEQFLQLGRGDARDLAFDLLAAYEGNALLANTLRDPGILASAASRINRWIGAL
jgi:TetR/AcrR family transcriptional regulator, transcriptional repressor for nem operon